jgi:DNA-binding CsgD family transcriptional regulator
MRKPAVHPPFKKSAPASRQPPRPLGAAMLSDLAWKEIALSLRLSGRELQIVRAMFDDRTELAIATDLGITRRTVHTHFERLHRKLAVSDRLQLALRIMDEFLMLTASPESKLPPICADLAAGRCPLRSSTHGTSESVRRQNRQDSGDVSGIRAVGSIAD